MLEHKKLSDFEPDNGNANKGSERGLRMLDDSLAQTGLGRSIVVDKHGRIIAGNKTHERAADSGFDEAILVTAVGSLPIRVGKQFEAGRKLGKTHQNVLVFLKGDSKAATDYCGPVAIYVPDETDIGIN